MEKRAYPRIKFDRAVKCITPQLLFDCRAVDISLGGCCLRSPINFDNGEELALLIPLNGQTEKMLIALGKVVWTKSYAPTCNDYPFYTGIQFLATTQKNFPELKKICSNPE